MTNPDTRAVRAHFATLATNGQSDNRRSYPRFHRYRQIQARFLRSVGYAA